MAEFLQQNGMNAQPDAGTYISSVDQLVNSYISNVVKSPSSSLCADDSHFITELEVLLIFRWIFILRDCTGLYRAVQPQYFRIFILIFGKFNSETLGEGPGHLNIHMDIQGLQFRDIRDIRHIRDIQL